MSKVLLTGGSGFLGAHVLDTLLKRGHSVVTTVRNSPKADKIREAYPQYSKDKLDFAFVPDIAAEGAFDEAVKSSPPFQAVIHTASPYTFAVKDIQKELLDPAVLGTTGVLKSIKKYAPSVKRVVITSSFAAIVNRDKGAWPEHTYTEADWNPVTHEEALENAAVGYSASKTFAEKAAWNFVEEEKPNFTLTTINPPMIYGPIINYMASLDQVNTSNSRIRDAMLGKWKTEVPETGLFISVDVRDAAFMHVLTMESDSAAGQRVFTVGTHYSNKEIVEAVQKHYPEYIDNLPGEDVKGGDYPDGSVNNYFKFDNSRAKGILGHDFIPFEKTITDLVLTLKKLGA